MDPFTITTSVLRITTTCIDAAKSLNDIRNAWERAPVTVSSLCSQLKLTSASLSQIQVLILGENDILKEKPDLVETFDTTLTSCLVLSTWLDSIMQRITKGVLEASKATWRAKFKTVWNESEIKELVEQLHTQQGAIGVLIGLLQMDSISEIRNLVRRHEALLQEIARNTRRSRTRHSIEARSSILLTEEASSSILSKLATDAKSESPSREENLKTVAPDSGAPSPKPPLINLPSASKPPLLSLPPVPTEQVNKAKSTRESSPNRSKPRSPTPVKTRSPSPFKAHVYDRMHCEELRPHLPIANFVTVEQSFLAAKEHLQVSSVEATAWMDQPTTLFGKLQLTENQKLLQIRKANDYWYYCQLGSPHNLGRAIEGLVERSNMVMKFMLREPLLAHATRTCRKPSKKNRLEFEQGDVLELNAIHHSILWTARRRTSQNDSPLKYINVLDIGLFGESRKHFDSLLEFVACPHPDLVVVSGDELVRRMKLLRLAGEENRKEVCGRLFAHCRSFADLQLCAKVVDEWSAFSSLEENPVGMI